jgi:hypothetical protein
VHNIPIERKRSVLLGILFGIVSNVLFMIESSLIIFAILPFFFLFFLSFLFLVSEKRLKIREVRLVFFGISLTSFVFALLDVMRFLIGYHRILLLHDFPYIMLGDISFFSILASFSLGGFFGVIERFIELLEKKDL